MVEIRIVGNVKNRSLAAWNAMIAAAARASRIREVLDLYMAMRIAEEESTRPDRQTFISVLGALSSSSASCSSSFGEIVHSDVRSRGLEGDPVVGTALLSMYGRCGSVENAYKVFGLIQKRDLVSWNAMIMACAENEESGRAFGLMWKLWLEGLTPNRGTFVALLSCCTDSSFLVQGRIIHKRIEEKRCPQDVVLSTALVTMYGRCGRIEEAQRVFENMPERNVVSWNAMITANAQYGHCKGAFAVYRRMQLEGVNLDRRTFVAILSACSSREVLPDGRKIHVCVSEAGFEFELVMGTGLITMYGNCGEAEAARCVFEKLPEKNVITWNAMLTVYADLGLCKAAIELFQEMREQVVTPNKVTYMSVLNSCHSPESLETGLLIHAEVVKKRLLESEPCIGNSLINMYSRCGILEKAVLVFEKGMIVKNTVSWNGILAALIFHRHFQEALIMFFKMQLEGFKPDRFTLLSLLDLCAELGTVDFGKGLHKQLAPSCSERNDLVVESALMSMFAKCGSVKDCEVIFQSMENHHQSRDLVAWNAMVAAYGQQGDGLKALRIFRRIQQEGLRPAGSTFVSVLFACSHAGLVEDACFCFNLVRDYGLVTNDHYACMVDVLGRRGYLREAEEFIGKMPISPIPATWSSLLGACRSYGNVEIGERIAKSYIKMDKPDAAWYVMLSNIYCAAEKCEDRSKQIKNTCSRRKESP